MTFGDRKMMPFANSKNFGLESFFIIVTHSVTELLFTICVYNIYVLKNSSFMLIFRISAERKIELCWSSVAI